MNSRIIIPLILLAVIITSVIGCGEDPVVVAQEVARDWTNTSVSEISEDIGAFSTGNIPLLKDVAASIVEGAIRDDLTWSYGKPQRLSDDIYLVVATASSDFDIFLIGSYTVSMDYRLEIDTKYKKVLDAPFDIDSFSISKN